MAEENFIDKVFDDILFQTHRGRLTYEQLDSGRRFEQFEQVKEWKSKYGYKFNIYGNDHLIDGKPHFHFDNAGQKISTKMDFSGNVLEHKGKNSIPKKVLEDLNYFLQKESTKIKLISLWNSKNPSIKI